MSDSLRSHGLQHTRLPCPSPTPRARSNSCLSSRWCHSTISSSVTPFSSCPQSFPADGDYSHEIKRRLLLERKAMTNLDSILKSRDITLLTKVHLVKAMVFPGSFPVSQFFTSGGQSIEASWFPLGLTGWISLQSKGLFKSLLQHHQFFGVQPSLWSNSHTDTWLL